MPLGTDTRKLRFHDHINLAHYTNAAVDIEFEFPFRFRELEGYIVELTLTSTSIQKLSGKKMQF